jgi:hypothetical protein
MKFIKSFVSFLTEKKEEENFEDKIKGHGYFKGISVSTARKKAAQMKDQANMPDDDPDAYKEMPGSTKGKKLLKPSKHTKNYKELYGESEDNIFESATMITATGLSTANKVMLAKLGADVKTVGPGFYISFDDKDRDLILDYLKDQDVEVNENLDESASGDRSPIDSDAIETALENKSKETGVPVPLLRIVMRRGMAAWKSGHRPGAGQEQWGYARINSFLTKAPGTWGRPLKDPVKGGPKGAYGADADVAKEVIDGGHDKKLK